MTVHEHWHFFQPLRTSRSDQVEARRRRGAAAGQQVIACSNFAKSLAHQGILTMERLKKMPVPQAKKALEIVKMTEFQIEAIMEALAPPPAAAPISPASSAPAPKPAIPTAQAASPAVPLHAKSGIVAPPTAQDKVRFSQLLLVELATPLFHSPPSRFQAAAAARIKGQPSIHDAASSGNAGLVRDHIVADPAAVHAKEINFLGRYVVCLCLFFQNYSMNPVSIVPSNFPLHPY